MPLVSRFVPLVRAVCQRLNHPSVFVVNAESTWTTVNVPWSYGSEKPGEGQTEVLSRLVRGHLIVGYEGVVEAGSSGRCMTRVL